MNNYLKLALAAVLGYFAYTFLKGRNKSESSGVDVISKARLEGILPPRSAGLFEGRIVETRVTVPGLGRPSVIVPDIEQPVVFSEVAAIEGIPDFFADVDSTIGIDRNGFDLTQNLILPDPEKTGKKRSRLISRK